ncbi:maleylacetate reductase [Aureimonas sp. D3]|uniref:maleylacetate reductase n=1 Tax=Aureimonas sp. D3 TaxID=1638164 RepID=UPI000784A28D|nr:maleylacetate reductase [Aureimonas sp. D3]
MSLPSSFVFKGLPTRVVFGRGTIQRVGEEVERLGATRALILSTPHQQADAADLAERLGSLAAGVFSRATMHTPVEVTQDALEAYRTAGADCVVSLGGGSTTGLGKAIATRTGADQLVIPTTYAGSEMTDILGETQNARKTTRRDPSILPETVLYDADLTLGLPLALSVTSGLNALAHAAEALYAPDRNPIISLMAQEGSRAFARALPAIAADPADARARSDALYGAWLCGVALGGSTMGLHHKLCHVLGGTFDTPHAETHAIMLPHTVGFNAAVAVAELRPLAEIFGASPGVGLHAFATTLRAPLRLKDLGLGEADLDKAAEIAVASPYANPRPFAQTDIRALLQDAWEGRPPQL